MSQKQRIERDPVIGLMTGRWVEKKDPNGKIIQIFQPSKRNPNSTLNDVRKVKSKQLTEDQIQVQEGLRYPPLVVNFSEFKKTAKEKKLLKAIKKHHNRLLRKAGFNPKKIFNLDPLQLEKTA